MAKTPKHGHAPIPMRRVEGDLVELGDFRWHVTDNGRRALEVAIPAPSRSGQCYSRWTIDHKNHCDASWSWDGNEDLPTLKPSLHAVGIWHGYVRTGQLVEA